ncbi:ACT domain-containing protein [Pseudodesulfovibrio sp.]|uniref:bifunctional uridylyltransferase/uridylyl-removing protein GlnD n=1 Tax=Pseudodesulfovibrio sp. TaxID=2035812 RepID=UPI0026091C58|nr:ACT domain-containing protein [Pseudodesulfovibrio sp.]MDD3311328.1 HD domain-containing protein [Pseudodesulfovibrio sp.]
MSADSHLPDSAKRLKSAREDLWRRAGSGSVGGFAGEYAHLVDRYFEERVLEAGPQRFAFTLAAVGGYGRANLCPGSDIDVLLLFNRRIPGDVEPFVKTLLFPLWDLGLDLGHGVRTVADCVSLSVKDYQVLASLLDARPLAGDASVFEAFRDTFDHKVLRRKGSSFAASLREHNETRAGQYGDATGMLEPELKNGLGGLRDGQQVRWLARVMAAGGRRPVFLPEELTGLREDQSFLNRVRTALHLAAGRKNDRLFFDLQPPTARLMGFVSQDQSPEAKGRGVEFFLSRLHRAMARIKAMREGLFLEGFPSLGPGDMPPSHPPNILPTPRGIRFLDDSPVTPDDALGALLESGRTGLPLSWAARRIVRGNAERFAAELRDRPGTLLTLVDIFLSPHAATACDGLVGTRLLPALFPAFAGVEHLIQFNDYHVHPVGRHTLATVARLSGFLRAPDWAGEIARRVPDPRRLLLAGFFHDLGKLEPDHCAAGERIAREVLGRYGCDRGTVEDVAFLVRNHLVLPAAATRRDLSDERVAAEVAGVAGNPVRLDMLHLLTVADSMATGPRAWNTWTGALLAELFRKVRNLLLHGPLAGPDAAERMVRARGEVLRAAGDLDPEFAEAAMTAMPPRAFLALDAVTLAGHIRLVRRLWDAVAEDRMRKPSSVGGKGVNLVEAEPGRVEGTYRLTVAALDRTGLFATMAGAIALHGMDILACDLFTWKDGTAVDVFTVGSPPENLFIDEVWARLSRSIAYALVGKLDLDYRLRERRSSPLHKGRSGPELPPIVTLDNRGSDFYTIVEVAATDRTGFLYDMARTLAENGISIHVAMISTIEGRAADIFHVRDEAGQKIADPDRLEILRAALLEAAGTSTGNAKK